MKRDITITVILIFSFFIPEIKAETKKLEPIDYSLPVIKAVIARQEALRDNDRKILGEQWTKKSKEVIKEKLQPPKKRIEYRYGKCKINRNEIYY